MMSMTFLIGTLASLFLVIGSALPDTARKHPSRSFKNQCFALGNVGMAIYAYMRFLHGGSLFFLFLEAMMMLSTVLMLIDAKEGISRALILPAGIALSTATFLIELDTETLIFVAGLTVVSIGFTSAAETLRRSLLLALGSGLVAVFSAIQHDPIFLWMNGFFALFSLYNAWKIWRFSSQKVA